MLRNAFVKTLRDARRAIGWWSLGLIAMAALMIAVYPSVRDNPDLNKMVEDYPDAFKAFLGLGENVDYTSAVGYLNSELFAFMVPLLLLIAAIGAGARATAGEEERGTLDLLLANPISRRRLVTESSARSPARSPCSPSSSGWRCSSASRSLGWTSRPATSPRPPLRRPCSHSPSARSPSFSAQR